MSAGKQSLWILAAIAFLASQAGAQGPGFEVASVKPTQHGRNAEGLSISDDPKIVSPGTLSVINNSLDELIRWAYGVKEYQISGPKWLNEESFDILAKMPPQTSKADLRLMMQTLLRDRFKLAVHRETRELPVYELLVAKGGPKLKDPKPGAKTGISYMGKFWSETHAETTTMAQFAGFLSDRMEHPVIDKTGVQTSFVVNLEYRNHDNDTTRPSIFDVLQEKLGLRLQTAKGPVEILVIDHIEKAPSEN